MGKRAAKIRIGATWGSDALSTWSLTKSGGLATQTSTFIVGSAVGVQAHVVSGGQPLSGAQVFVEIRTAGGAIMTTLRDLRMSPAARS